MPYNINEFNFQSTLLGAVPEQVNVTVRVLSRVGVIGGTRSTFVADFTPGFVTYLRNLGSVSIGDDAGRAQVVADNKEQISILSHGYSLCACVIVLGHDSVGLSCASMGHFVVRADIGRQHRFYTLSIAVVGEGRSVVTDGLGVTVWVGLARYPD